ncbi:DUF4097 family beta strand repeat-containing protein [Clostridium sporogenes]|uniref:DUF4097 family beta strand repeat-containing protein n=1 Tax=Clostridium sporogenes TaxID=1509 RepID=UPI003F908E51
MSILGIGSLFLFKEINEKKHFTMDEINEIQVNMTSEAVHIIRTEASNEVKFHYYGKSMQKIKLASEINNKAVVVAAKRQHEGPIPEDMVLDIYIPEKYGKNLSINLLSGAVKMDSFDLASFIYSNRSGKLETEKISANNISMNTYSGNINIKKIDAKELEIKSLSAAINMEWCITEKARIENSSGSIILKNSSGNFDLKGKSGKVMVDYKEFENQNINIETLSGSVTLELPRTAEFFIEAETSSGKFQTDFPIKMGENTDKTNIRGEIGGKNNKVSIKTSSGSMKILKK